MYCIEAIITALGIKFLEASTDKVSAVAKANNKTYTSLRAASNEGMSYKKHIVLYGLGAEQIWCMQWWLSTVSHGTHMALSGLCIGNVSYVSESNINVL